MSLKKTTNPWWNYKPSKKAKERGKKALVKWLMRQRAKPKYPDSLVWL